MKTQLFDRYVSTAESGRAVAITVTSHVSRYVFAIAFLTLVGGIAGIGFYGFGSAVSNHEMGNAAGRGLFAAAFALFLGFVVYFFLVELRRVRIRIDSLSGVCRVTRFRTASIALSELSAVTLDVTGDGDGSSASFSLCASGSRRIKLFSCSFHDGEPLAYLQRCRDFGSYLAKSLHTRLVQADTRPWAGPRDTRTTYERKWRDPPAKRKELGGFTPPNGG